eukprot:3207557-Pyramimonas_sp.AAC.1
MRAALARRPRAHVQLLSKTAWPRDDAVVAAGAVSICARAGAPSSVPALPPASLISSSHLPLSTLP